MNVNPSDALQLDILIQAKGQTSIPLYQIQSGVWPSPALVFQILAGWYHGCWFHTVFHMFKGHTAPLRWEWWSWFSMSAWSHHVATWEKTIDTSGVVSLAQCLPSTTRHLFDTRGGAGKFLMLTWACQLLRGPTGWFRAVLLGREGWKTNQEPPLSCREPLHDVWLMLHNCMIITWTSILISKMKL